MLNLSFINIVMRFIFDPFDIIELNEDLYDKNRMVDIYAF